MSTLTTTTDAVLVPIELPPDRSPALVYLARLSASSRRVMGAALNGIAAAITSGHCDAVTCPWGALRYQHTVAIRTKLAERYAPATANQHLAALRGTLKECWRLDLMDAEDYHRAVDLPAVRGETLPAGRELDAGELRALFGLCAEDKGPAGPRDAALLAILYAGGLRRSEAAALDLSDFDSNTGALTVRNGKGRKARQVYATNGGRDAIESWLAARGDEPGALLCPVNKGGRVTIRRMTSQAVYYALRRRAKKAGVASCTPHDLRRSFISHLLDAGADIATVQRMAGHAQVTTTARYDRRGEEAKRKAAELLHVPYSPPGR